MSKVFNTTFEISLRVLLILQESAQCFFTTDMLAAIDFIAVYGEDFSLAEHNLHGENPFRYSEFSLRRELMKQAVKSLVLEGFLSVKAARNGFVYAISLSGADYCVKFESDYAKSYRVLVRKALSFVSNHNERDILTSINRRSVSAFQRGD